MREIIYAIILGIIIVGLTVYEHRFQSQFCLHFQTLSLLLKERYLLLLILRAFSW